MENNVKENNNKGIIIVLIVVIIGLVLFIGYDKLIKKDTNNNSNSNSVSNSNVESNSNNNIVSKEDEQIISKKLALLFNDTKYTTGKNIKYTGENSYFPSLSILTNNIKDEDKNGIIIKNMKISYEKEITDYEQFNGRKEAFYALTDFDKNYMDLFGTKPNYVNVNGCPSYYYNKNSEAFFTISECGYFENQTIVIYIDSMKKEDKNVLVDVYAGTIKEDSDGIIYYNDVLQDTNTKTEKYDSITEETKTNFQKYTLIFENKDNNYYYVSTKK